MLEEAEARERILNATRVAGTESIPLVDARHRIAAKDVFAKVALPGFDNSQMDGYAVRACDAPTGAKLTVVGEQPAGAKRPLTVGPGQAVRIFTGAPMPEGADAVVMQEDVERLEDQRIRLMEGVELGEFVRREGADLCLGQKILSAGQLLNPARIGVLASQGLAEIEVGRRPRCAIVTTGDELLAPGSKLEPGAIFNSNGPMLANLAQEFGAGQVRRYHASDDPAQLRETLDQALTDSDVCLVAGGVSVGEHDHVKAQLASLGVEGGFWRVRVKPGKPLFFGQRGPQCIFGLPGNPVSAYITFLLFVVGVLKKWQGETVSSDRPHLLSLPAQALESVINDRGNRPHYVRGWFDPTKQTFRPIGLQQSHALFALSQTNALVRVEPGETIDPGQPCSCYLSSGVTI